jgi:hypothetical protein
MIFVWKSLLNNKYTNVCTYAWGKSLSHVKEYFNDVARNICVVFYLHDMEYSIKYFLKLIHTHAHKIMPLITHNL